MKKTRRACGISSAAVSVIASAAWQFLFAAGAAETGGSVAALACAGDGVSAVVAGWMIF